MTNNSNQDVVNQMDTLAQQTTQTLVDAAYLAQRQTAELVQAWLNTLDQNQQQQRDIATQLMQQAQEGQRLLRQFVQETARSSTEAFKNAAQTGANTMSNAAQTGADTMSNAAQSGANTVSETVNRGKHGQGGNRSTPGS